MSSRDQKVARDLARLRRASKFITLVLEFTMKTMDELTDKINELGQDLSDYEAREASTVEALKAQIADLQTKLDAGSTVDAQSQIDLLQTIIDSIPTGAAPAETPADPSAPTSGNIAGSSGEPVPGL